MDSQDNSEHPVDLIFDAVAMKDLDRLEALLNSGIDPDIVGGPADHTPLGYSIQDGFIEGARLLIRRGANPSPRRAGFDAPLFAAASLTDNDGSLILCRELLAAGADTDERDREGRTALYEAAILARSELCQLLIDHGARVDVESNYGNTPLRAIAGQPEPKFVDTMRVLTKGGADPSRQPSRPVSRDPERLTPFQIAVASGEVRNVAFFLDECNEDPDQITQAGRTMIDLSGGLTVDEVLHAASSARAIALALESAHSDEQRPTLRSNAFGIL